jgi:hypothetical protein
MTKSFHKGIYNEEPPDKYIKLNMISSMKKILSVTMLLTCVAIYSMGQGVGIGTTSPDPSAKLEVQSSTQGTLITRMSTAQRNAIVSPAIGLMIFNTSTNCINIFMGNSWKQICAECEFSSPVAGNNGPLCQGSTLNLTSTSIAGATYQWTGPNGFISSLQNPSLANVGTTAAGVYSVVATLNGCASPPQNTSLVVHATPATAVAGNSGAVCVGGTLSLNASSVSGATYAWTGPNNFTANTQNPLVSNNVQSNMAGKYYVSTSINSCTSVMDSTIVIVNAIPGSPSSITGTITLCANSLGVQYSIPAVASATSYNWTLPSGAIITANAGTSITVNFGTTSGNIFVSAANLCGSSAKDSLFIQLDSTSSAFTYSSAKINLPVTFVPAVSGAISYNWTFSSGSPASSTLESPSILWTSQGTYNVSLSITGSNGCSSTTTHAVYISNTPVTQTFSYTGATQTFVVPAGVTSIKIEAWGAEGGMGRNNGSLANAGKGGYVYGEKTVVPGSTLYINVGGKGTDAISSSSCCAGGWNGGGLGAYGPPWSGNYVGGGGGGASDVRLGGTALSDRIIVAGAGAGGSYYIDSKGGDGAYSTGGDGTRSGSTEAACGRGGTQSAGGAGGTDTGNGLAAQSGSLGLGGDAGVGGCGGAGGGGYYGGGGGSSCNGGGGGGGSSYFGGMDANTGYSNGGRTGDGEVVITY